MIDRIHQAIRDEFRPGFAAYAPETAEFDHMTVTDQRAWRSHPYGPPLLDMNPSANLAYCPAFVPTGDEVRGVAQLGSVLRSGRRGPGFESRHPDQICEAASP